MNLSILYFLPEHWERDECNIYRETPRFKALGIRIDILLDGLNSLLEIAIVKVFLSESGIKSALSCLFPLVLAHIKDVFESFLHLVVPLCAHPVFLDSLPLEHVSNVTLNL